MSGVQLERPARLPLRQAGKSVAADYVYIMAFDGAKIGHMTKLWNDAQTLRSLGWG